MHPIPRWRAFLRLAVSAAALTLVSAQLVTATPAAPPIPVFPVREFYAPGHFGNSFEVMGQFEMRDTLQEAVHWGFNRYCDWFDMEDCCDPFAEKRLIQLAHIVWQHKKDNFRTAQSLGLACDLTITPNFVFVDQCRPESAPGPGGPHLRPATDLPLAAGGEGRDPQEL